MSNEATLAQPKFDTATLAYLAYQEAKRWQFCLQHIRICGIPYDVDFNASSDEGPCVRVTSPRLFGEIASYAVDCPNCMEDADFSFDHAADQSPVIRCTGCDLEWPLIDGRPEEYTAILRAGGR